MSKLRMIKLSSKQLSMNTCNSLEQLGYDLFRRNEVKITQMMGEFFLKQTKNENKWRNIFSF
jgi:hypothetical protein